MRFQDAFFGSIFQYITLKVCITFNSLIKNQDEDIDHYIFVLPLAFEVWGHTHVIYMQFTDVVEIILQEIFRIIFIFLVIFYFYTKCSFCIQLMVHYRL